LTLPKTFGLTAKGHGSPHALCFVQGCPKTAERDGICEVCFLTALLLFLPVVALAQVEVNGKGEPVALQNAQWQGAKISTPFGVVDGWRTRTRTQNPHYLVFWFEPTRKVVEVSFIVKAPPKGQRGLTFGLSYGAPTHWANEAIRLALGGNGFVLQRDVGDWFTWRSRFSWLTVQPFAFEQWLKVQIVADPTIGAFRLWLNDKLAFDLLPFLSPVPQISCFFLFNGEGDGATIEVSEPELKIGTLPNAPKSLQVVPVGHDRLLFALATIRDATNPNLPHLSSPQVDCGSPRQPNRVGGRKSSKRRSLQLLRHRSC
jgi:hypothetical protein